MTEPLLTYHVDSIPVADLPKRYGIGRSAFYDRRDALSLKFELRGNRSFATAEQVDVLDALHDYLKQPGHTIAEFVESLNAGQSTRQTGQLTTLEESSLNPTAAMLTLAQMLNRVISPPDPLAHIRLLQEACDRSWLLSSSELAPLLKRSRVKGQTIKRYGFVCTRVGRNGAESAWKITRAEEL